MIRIQRTDRGLQLEFEPGEADLLRALPAHLAGAERTARYARDEQTDAELHQLLDADLRARRVARAGEFVSALSALQGPTLTLDEAQADHWLAVLTDLRLTLADRIGLTEANAEQVLNPENPASREAALYLYLTGLQSALLHHGFGVEQDPDWR